MRKKAAVILVVCFYLFVLPAVFVVCPDAAGILFICSCYLLVIWGCVRGVKRWSAKRPADRERSGEAWGHGPRGLNGDAWWSDPAYSWMPGNIFYSGSDDSGGFHQNDWTIDPSYSFMEGNIYHHDDH